MSKRLALLISGLALALFASFLMFQRNQQLPFAEEDPADARPEQAVQVAQPESDAQDNAEENLADSLKEEEIADPDSRKFLDLVAQSSSPERVFETEANHVIAHQIDGRWVAQTDMLVDEKTFVVGAGNTDTQIVKFDQVQRWTNNIVPFRIDSSLNPDPITKAITIMNQNTNIRFVEYHGESDFVYFRHVDDKACLSYLGRKGGEQDILLNLSHCSVGSIVHEMMHAIGFVHEHSRSDRDNYLKIYWENIRVDSRNQFQKMTADISLSTLGPFDFDSILLYPSNAFAIGEQPTMTKIDGSVFEANRSRLSKGDIAKINSFYPTIPESAEPRQGGDN